MKKSSKANGAARTCEVCGEGKSMPINRAFRLLKLSRTVYDYSAKKPDDGKIKEAVMTIVE